PGEPIDIADQAVGVEDQDAALGHFGHEAEELDVVAVKAIGVVEGHTADLPGWRRPDALHQREVARASRGFLARPVGVLEMLEGKPFQLWSSQDRVQLLAQRGTTRASVG